MKRLIALFLIVCLLPGLTACAPNQTEGKLSAKAEITPDYPSPIAFDDYAAARINRENNPVSDAQKQAVNHFSYVTASAVLQDIAINGCYSPLSLYLALSLAGTGANGKTRNEIFKLLGASDPDDLSQDCGNLYRRLYIDNDISRLKIANSLWLDDEYDGEPVLFREYFTQNAAAQFYASLFKADFAAEQTALDMAQWIAEQSDGTLQPVFQVDPEQIMSIINTIYFQDQWIDRFDAALTKPDAFHRADGTDVTCDFMNRIYTSAGFSKGDGFTRSALSLKSNGSMVFVLPDEGTTLQELLSRPARLQEIFEGGQQANGQVTWKIPKFTCDTELDLADTLKQLGVKSAFRQDADFSGITDHIAFISSITQNTHLAIDEVGVTAAAFTKISYAGAARPDGQADMILDRPFLYGITSATGNLLFIGICGDPSITRDEPASDQAVFHTSAVSGEIDADQAIMIAVARFQAYLKEKPDMVVKDPVYEATKKHYRDKTEYWSVTIALQEPDYRYHHYEVQIPLNGEQVTLMTG
jgi:serpin B